MARQKRTTGNVSSETPKELIPLQVAMVASVNDDYVSLQLWGEAGVVRMTRKVFIDEVEEEPQPNMLVAVRPRLAPDDYRFTADQVVSFDVGHLLAQEEHQEKTRLALSA
jgi:hypothetical protein